MSSAPLNYTPQPHATPETELDSLAAVYRFILFESNGSKKATCPGGPNDAEDLENDRTTQTLFLSSASLGRPTL